MTTVSKPLPPVLLLLDVSVLVSSSLRDWQQFSAVGTCLLPQAVFEEMQLLFNQAPDQDLERVAREFQRFQTAHKWQSIDIVASHPLLRGASGQAMSKKARMALSVAKCAYGLAKQYPSRLVVLATNDQTQIQRLQMLQMPNLCSITGAVLRQWTQAGRRPIPVLQHWQQMKTAGLLDAPPVSGLPIGSPSGVQSKAGSDLYSGLSRARSGAAAVGPSTGIPTSQVSKTSMPRAGRVTRSRYLSDRPNSLSQLLSLLVATAILVTALWFGWRLFQPDALREFWQDDTPATELQ